MFENRFNYSLIRVFVSIGVALSLTIDLSPASYHEAVVTSTPLMLLAWPPFVRRCALQTDFFHSFLPSCTINFYSLLLLLYFTTTSSYTLTEDAIQQDLRGSGHGTTCGFLCQHSIRGAVLRARHSKVRPQRRGDLQSPRH